MNAAQQKILLVDDEPFILNCTAQLLRGAGYEVHTCEQWAGIAAVVRLEEPDLILMDYHMPSIKGDDLCLILKRNAIKEGLKIMIFSSESENELLRIAGRCGADGYIKKSLPGHQLLDQVGRALDVRPS